MVLDGIEFGYKDPIGFGYKNPIEFGDKNPIGSRFYSVYRPSSKQEVALNNIRIFSFPYLLHH